MDAFNLHRITVVNQLIPFLASSTTSSRYALHIILIVNISNITKKQKHAQKKAGLMCTKKS